MCDFVTNLFNSSFAMTDYWLLSSDLTDMRFPICEYCVLRSTEYRYTGTPFFVVMQQYATSGQIAGVMGPHFHAFVKTAKWRSGRYSVHIF
jgi:hypothetical protein